jgi:hypothetical protein
MLEFIVAEVSKNWEGRKYPVGQMNPIAAADCLGGRFERRRSRIVTSTATPTRAGVRSAGCSGATIPANGAAASSASPNRYRSKPHDRPP